LVSNGHADFRACLGAVASAGAAGVILSRETADALEVEVGASVRTVSLRAEAAAPKGERCTGT